MRSAGFAKDCLPPCEACVNAGTSIEEAANELDPSQQHHTHTTTPSSPHLRGKHTPNEQQKCCGDAPMQRNPNSVQACRKTPGRSLLLFVLACFPKLPLPCPGHLLSYARVPNLERQRPAESEGRRSMSALPLLSLQRVACLRLAEGPFSGGKT